ncbi:MAG TPA: hypothetical protein VEL76_11285 [Gemmataceae bacterium]|nr:hypothetical protein [Gemmataceae bacterium]
MNTSSSFREQIQRAFTPASRGVVDLVDRLLGLCRESGLRLDWKANQCRVRSLETEGANATEIPLQKSVFRAILARVAVLCNERSPNSVSPYGGNGELLAGTNPPTILQAAFVNTPAEQQLELRPGRAVGDGNETKSHAAPDPLPAPLGEIASEGPSVFRSAAKQ